MAALSMESNHLNEDHERLMERHSTLLQEMASKEKAARDKHDQLLKLANQAERARQDAVANLQQETEALRQSYRVSLEFDVMVHSYFVLFMHIVIFYIEHKYLIDFSLKSKASKMPMEVRLRKCKSKLMI